MAQAYWQANEPQIRQFEKAWQDAKEQALAEEDTLQLLSWKVRYEVIEETSALWSSVKCVPPPQSGACAVPRITILGFDLLHHLMSSRLELARLLFATSKQFQAVASKLLHEHVPRFLLTGNVELSLQKSLGNFAQRHERINGRPSYLCTVPASRIIVYYCRVSLHWCVGTMGWIDIYPPDPVARFLVCNSNYAQGQDPEDPRRKTLIQINPLFMFRASRQVDAAGHALAPHAIAFHLSLGVPMPISDCGTFHSRLDLLPSIRCLSLDALAAESALAPSTVHLVGSSPHPKHQHALGRFTKLDEPLHGYPVYGNPQGYRMWHACNAWHVGSWEIDDSHDDVAFHALLRVEDSRFDPSETGRDLDRNGEAEKTWTWTIRLPYGSRSDVRCFDEPALREELWRSSVCASPVIALCGHTPFGAHREVIGQYVKASNGVDGSQYAHYVNDCDPATLLWRHNFAWTVGRRDQQLAGEWGHFVVVDSALVPENITGTWQALGTAGFKGVPAPDLQIFVPAKRVRSSCYP